MALHMYFFIFTAEKKNNNFQPFIYYKHYEHHILKSYVNKKNI